jgi:hypothetical protein
MSYLLISSFSSSGSPVVTTSTTNERTIRDWIVTLISQVAPVILPGTGFVPYRNEGDGDFVAWCEANPTSSLRRYQVRDTGVDVPPDVSNLDVEWRTVTFSILVAYPQSHRYGAQNALDRDDAMSTDQINIESAVGLRGYANFTGANPNASWMLDGYSVERRIGGACDFLIITQTMGYYWSATTA